MPDLSALEMTRNHGMPEPSHSESVLTYQRLDIGADGKPARNMVVGKLGAAVESQPAPDQVAEAETAAVARIEDDGRQGELHDAFRTISEVASDEQLAQRADAKRPRRADYADADGFDGALAQWAADRAIVTNRAKAERDKATATVAEIWRGRREKAFETYADYVEVAEAQPQDGGPVITEPMARAIFQAQRGPDIAYHLGKNPDEAKRIAKLPPAVAVAEIGKLDERLSPAPARREAREPGRTAAPRRSREPSMNDYAANRMKELQASRGSFFGRAVRS